MTQSLQRRLVPLAAAAVLPWWRFRPVQAQTSVPDGEWHAIGRDAANTKYSPLDQIDADNFTDLEIAWRWTSLSTAVAENNEQIRPSQFKSVPLMADGLVYVSTALGQVAALDAGTGETVWSYDPQIYAYLDRPPNMGWHHRGVSYWKDSESDDARIFIASHDKRLVALERAHRPAVSRLRDRRLRRPHRGVRARDRRLADDLVVAGRHRRRHGHRRQHRAGHPIDACARRLPATCAPTTRAPAR